MDRQEAGGERAVRAGLRRPRPCVSARSPSIYILFWTLSLFLVLPWGVRTSEEEGASPSPATPTARRTSSGPARWRCGRRSSATVLFGLYYVNYVNGWVTVEDVDWLR
jgi:predicted secreted protein